MKKKEDNQDIDKDGNAKVRRKISPKYIGMTCFMLAFSIGLFLVLVFQYHILEPVGKAEVTQFYSVRDGYYAHYMVDGEELKTHFGSTAFLNGYGNDFSGAGDYLYYLVSDPSVVMVNRTNNIIWLSIIDGIIFLSIIPLTVYEIKKGCGPTL